MYIIIIIHFVTKLKCQTLLKKNLLKNAKMHIKELAFKTFIMVQVYYDDVKKFFRKANSHWELQPFAELKKNLFK